MKELVKFTPQHVDGASIETVNARELHTKLEVRRDFSNWIKGRITEYQFVEGQDFVIDSPNLANQSGRGGDRRSVEYHLSLDMAKELSMLENNAKGRQIRRYFIARERQAVQGAKQIARLESRLAALENKSAKAPTMIKSYKKYSMPQYLKYIELEIPVEDERFIDSTAYAICKRDNITIGVTGKPWGMFDTYPEHICEQAVAMWKDHK
jgi:phage anti-repressor protein